LPSNEEAELLRWRASRMLARARECLRDGDHDLAVFLAEQGPSSILSL